VCDREGRGFLFIHPGRSGPLYRFCSMGCLTAGSTLAKENTGMIDKTAREIQALKDARRPFAEALTDLGLMEPFFHRSPADIDRLIESVVTGYVDSMQRQAGVQERTGTTLDDPLPF